MDGSGRISSASEEKKDEEVMKEANAAAQRKTQQMLTDRAMSREEFLISRYLGELRFSHRLWGVDELEVWRALEKLTELYEDALTVERSRRELAQRKLEALKFRTGEESSHG